MGALTTLTWVATDVRLLASSLSLETSGEYGASASRRTVRAKRGKDEPWKSHIKDSVEYFWQNNGDFPAWSWFTGIVVADAMAFAWAQAPDQRCGLVQTGNMPIRNKLPWDSDGALGSADGIMGLRPACVKPGSQVRNSSQNTTDPISNLFWKGAISAHAFTICLHDSEQCGGRVFLGSSGSDFPQGTVQVGLGFDSDYKFLPPAGSPDIPVHFGGGRPIYILNASMYFGLFGEESYIDSGTGDFLMPTDVYQAVMGRVADIWSADPDINTTVSVQSVLSYGEVPLPKRVATKR